MKSLSITLSLAFAATIGLTGCGNLSNDVEAKLKELKSKTESLDSLVNQEVDKVHSLDSLINSETEKLNKLDSIANAKMDRYEKILQ